MRRVQEACWEFEVRSWCCLVLGVLLFFIVMVAAQGVTKEEEIKDTDVNSLAQVLFGARHSALFFMVKEEAQGYKVNRKNSADKNNSWTLTYRQCAVWCWVFCFFL